MQREHAQIMKITNVFYPISTFAQTYLIIELKLTVYPLFLAYSFKNNIITTRIFLTNNALNCFIVNKFVEFVVMRMTK
jgi:hypothetical protein